VAGLTNKEIARVFKEIEILLKVAGRDGGRAMTYGRVSRLLETLDASAADLAVRGTLTDVKGIGPSVQRAVAELVDTGSCKLRDDLAAEIGTGVLEILRVPGLGPKRIHAAVEQLGVASIEDLQAAAVDGRLAALSGFGRKTAEKVLEGIEFLNRTRGVVRIDVADRIARDLAERLGLADAVVAGPVRRGAPLSDSVTLVATGDPTALDVAGATLEGDTWVAPRGAGPELRLRLVPRAALARAVFEETGPSDHVAAVLARPGGEATEEEIYRSRGLHFVPPERRHACDGTQPVPRLVERGDLRGLVHAHTTWSDGTLDLAGMAEAAHARGYSYLTVTDHSRIAVYANGLDLERLARQAEAIRAFNAAGGPVRLLHGIEVDILSDGALDYPDEVLARLDCVIASVHSSFAQDETTMTARLVRAARNPHVHVLGHLTGRLLGRRGPYHVDVGAVLQAAAEAGTAVELNANPWRLDLDPEWHAAAMELGIGIPIGPDAHGAEGMDHNEWGVRAARHGGLRPSDVPNTLDADGFLARIAR